MMEPSRGVIGIGGGGVYPTQIHAPGAMYSAHYHRHHHHPIYKQDSNGFEVSMGMQDRPPDPQFIAEQTFHTPSFGDEEFEIPPITLPSSTTSSAPPSGNFVQNYADSLDHSHTMGGQQMDHVTSSAPPMMHYAPQSVYLSSVNEAGTMLAPAPHQFQQQQQQQPRMMTHHHQAQHQQQQQQQQQQHCGVTSTSNLMTISQSQLSAHLGLHFTVPVAVPATSSAGSPPRSDQTSPRQETSEDSDDSAGITHALMDGWMKRPSPDPPGAKTVAKKSKVPKKKKKRDPNEPQKPVSAYALFFRDTQAAIKGQNPNASFGEVSKIVASMWDSLDDDHKNVYKKKTEAAKKEYLKALAAYRASLVSTSGSADQADSSSGAVYGSGAFAAPPHFSAVPTTTSHGGNNGGGNGGNGQQLSPLQKKSPLLTSLMEGSMGASSNAQSPTQPPPLQHSPPHMIAPMTSQQGQMAVNAGLQSQQHAHQQQLQQVQGHISNIATRSPPLSQQQQQQLQQQHQQQQQLQQQQQQQQHMHAQQLGNHNTTSVYGHGQSLPLAHAVDGDGRGAGAGAAGNGGGNVGGEAGQVSDGSQLCFQSSPPGPNSGGPIRCLRSGCPNPAVESPDWDSEYCSNECVVSHCRDVFTAWVASRQTSNSYASVK